MRTNVHPSIRVYIRTLHDPVRLRLRHLYQVEFCSFIVRYPTAGASVYCGHSSSLKLFFRENKTWHFCFSDKIRLYISCKSDDSHEM